VHPKKTTCITELKGLKWYFSVYLACLKILHWNSNLNYNIMNADPLAMTQSRDERSCDAYPKRKGSSFRIKKSLLLLLPLLFIPFVFSSCELLDEGEFDESLLVGTWRSGTLHYKYFSNGTGGTWDTKDDVLESEAQAFTWTLQRSELIHIHVLEIGGSVPKIYKVTALTATSLQYEDSFGKKFSFTKVN